MEEADLIPLSALQHYLYCPRQCALIHIEQVWQENRWTAEGRLLHARTDEPAREMRRGMRTVMAMPIRSFRLGVAGIADVVEIVEGDGRLFPFPVEYKRGRPKAHRADEVQLCAQAYALEEMFGVSVPDGALFYGESRRRLPVSFDDTLRALTASVASETRSLLDERKVPRLGYDRSRCSACSLLDICKPGTTVKTGDVSRWLARMVTDG